MIRRELIGYQGYLGYDYNKETKELVKPEENMQKFINLHLDGEIDLKNYDEKFDELENSKDEQLKLISQLTLDSRDEKKLKERLRSFRKYFNSNKTLKPFDKAVFDSIVDKIILGGTDTKEQNNPYQITFVFKADPKPTISVGKGGKNGAIKDIGEIAENISSQLSDHSCGIGFETANKIFIEQYI